MNIFVRIIIGMVVLILVLGFFAFVMPSLIGFLITTLLLISINDFFVRRRRQAARAFNSAAQAVARQKGAISKVAMAFSRRGPLSGACHQYALRLAAGEDAIEAAGRARVPLQLTTAVAMTDGGAASKSGAESRKRIGISRRSVETMPNNSELMSVYAQIMYLVVTALVTCSVIGFISVFIVPTMEQMLEEFGQQMPNDWLLVGGGPTQALLTLAIVSLIALLPILTTGSLFGIPVPRWMPVSLQIIQDKTRRPINQTTTTSVC